jgi:hypothetical protein
MSDEEFKSQTHTQFLGIIKKYYGKSAYEMLKQRRNINIFNITEVNALHQQVFDNFGDAFVNRIINNDLSPESLVIVKQILSDEKKMKIFKNYYDFYTENIGKGQADFEKMIRGYHNFESLFEELTENNVKLKDPIKSTLVDILSDHKNPLQVRTLDDVNDFYNQKKRMYELNKSNYRVDAFYNPAAPHEMAQNIFSTFFGLDDSYLRNKARNFDILQTNPFLLCEVYNIDNLLQDPKVNAMFSKEEREMLLDMQEIVKTIKEYDEYDAESLQKCVLRLREFEDKYEQKGPMTSQIAQRMMSKLPKTAEISINASISRVSDMEERVARGENGISKLTGYKMGNGKTVDYPVYFFDGADFAFLSTTNYAHGLSGNDIEGDLATSWFEFENGTPHICCSYATNDCLSNLEFHKEFDGDSYTCLFDEMELFTMGNTDIFSPEQPRVSNVFSRARSTMFSTGEELARRTKSSYNEVDINRFNYSGQINYGGKIIPSAILCSGEIKPEHVAVAESFTKYCVEHGLKPEGWKMPIVLVDKEKYLHLKAEKKKAIMYKESQEIMKDFKETMQKDNIISNNQEIEEKEINKKDIKNTNIGR